MNGFIFYINGLEENTYDLRRVLPIVDGNKYDLKRFKSGDTLHTWGYASGDIYWVEKKEKAILIISGYISEFESGPKFGSQDEAGRYVLEQFLSSDSNEAIKCLLNRVHGSFGLVFRDLVQNKTICATDRMASRQLWYCQKGSGWVVSTHSMAAALSIQTPRFDLAGLGAFLLYGGPVDPKGSLFNEVYAIPAGSIYRLYSKGNIEINRWYKFHHQENKNLTEREWIKLVADRLQLSATRIGRICKEPAIFFSGGTDSRLAASAMKSAGANPLLVTLAGSQNIEVRVAKLASKALRLRHIVITRDRHWYMRTLPQAIYETGGSYVWTHGHFSEAAKLVQRKFGADGFLLGDCCEAFSKILCRLEQERNKKWDYKKFAKSFDQIRLKLYRPDNRKATLSLLKPALRRQIEDALCIDIENRFKDVCSLAIDPLIIGDLCFRWESLSTCPTFFMFLDLRRTSSERNLMFDRDVHELLEIMPSKMRNENNLGARVINQLQPLAAWVMNSNSLVPMIWPFGIHRTSKRIKPILGHIRRAIIGKSHMTTGSWPDHSILYAKDELWNSLFKKTILNENLYDPNIFDINEIKRCWNNFENGQKDRYIDIEKIFQIGMLSKLCIEGSSKYFEDCLKDNIGDKHQ